MLVLLKSAGIIPIVVSTSAGIIPIVISMSEGYKHECEF